MSANPVAPNAPDTPGSEGSEALRFVSNPRFHRTLTLPASANHDHGHGELTVSYADLGRAPDPQVAGSSPPTILFMPGMFASRYLGVAMHLIAETMGVRLLVVDRPGMGKSTDVPLQHRVAVWVELVPRFLAHVGVQHVSLVSHSAGTIFLLNTLAHCRDILYPERPSISLLAPWVDPAYSHVTSMQMAQYVPAPAFNVWNLIPQFFLLKAGPAVASSGAVVTKASNMLSSMSGLSGGGNAEEKSGIEKNRRLREERYRMSREFYLQLDDQIFKSMFGENTVGANSEALQCLRKGQNWSWGDCGDYARYVKDLADRERRRRAPGSGLESLPKLKVRAYFGETDAMIGKKGQTYMEKCWNGTPKGEFQDVLDFQTTTIPETDHDTIMQFVEVLEKCFVDAGGVIPETAA